MLSPVAACTDGVVVATSHSSHAEIGLKALHAGFHVFMEKPMTTDPAEASSLANAAVHQDKVFLVNNTANFRESAQNVREVVKSTLPWESNVTAHKLLHARSCRVRTP